MLVLSILFSVLPTVFSEEDAKAEAIPAADELFRQIDELCSGLAKRGGTPGESAFAALSDDVYALVEASGTAVPDSLAANGDFIHWVDRETGVPCCYSPDHEAAKADMTAQTQPSTSTEEIESLMRSMTPKNSTVNSDCPQSLNVGLLQPYWESNTEYKDSDFLRYSSFYLQQANRLAEKTEGNMIRFSLSDVTPDTIAFTLQNCGIILINTHATTDYKNGNDKTSSANSSYLWLNAGDKSIREIKSLLLPEDYSTIHSGIFGNYSDVYFSGSDYCVNGTVIANHMTQDSPNSLIYFGCCLVMATDGIIAPLRKKGVAAGIGYSQTVTFKGDHLYLLSITESLIEDKILAEAMSVAKQEVGITDPYKIINPCYPIVVSPSDSYPGHGHVDAPQTVTSVWHLSTYRVSFSLPYSVSSIPSVYCGDSEVVTLPGAEDLEGYTFAGWSLTPIGNASSVSNLLYENEFFSPSFNSTLYAVYTRKETHSGAYVKVTTAPSVFNGSFLIVYEADGRVFNASASDIDTSQNYITCSIENHRIADSAAVEAAAVTIHRVSGKPYYSIQLPNGKYIGNLGSGSGINLTMTLAEAYANNITFNAQERTVTIQNTAGNYSFKFNVGSASNRFSYYDTESANGNLREFCLYRKDSNALVDVYTTAPDTACAHEAWSTVVTASTCLRGGFTTKTCTNCGATWTTGNTAALGHWFNSGVVTPATDGSFGYTTYTCRRAGCGYSYQTDFNGLDYQVTLNVLGSDRQTLTINSYDGALLPDPEDTVNGYAFEGWSETAIVSESTTADLIDDLYYPMEDATVYAVYSRSVDGIVFYSTTQKALKINSASLILNGKIDVAFTVLLPAGYTNPRMVVNGTQINTYSTEQGSCVFIYTGINPQCIGDNLTATLYATNSGIEESVSVENYSVRQYCVNKLADGTISDELRTLLSDLLAYGEAAQLYTGYQMEKLVTDGDDISDPMYSFLFYLSGYRASFSGEADEHTRWMSAGLTLTDSVAMTFRFHAEDTDGLTVAIGMNGRTQTFSDFTAVNGMSNAYEITFTGISAEEFADNVTASFVRNGASEGNTLSYSVNAYVQSNLNSADTNLAYLVAALYNYGASAGAYMTNH